MSPMPKQSQRKSVVSKIASKRDLDANDVALKSYDSYKKAADIIERAEFASGQRVIFKSDTGSTLNFEINRYGATSTTAKIV